MSERADYYIEKVRYNKNHTRIVWVSVRHDTGKKLSPAINMARKRLITLIQEGKQFMTILRSEEGKFRKGKKLLMMQFKDAEYLRTDEAPVENDRLEDLPEY